MSTNKLEITPSGHIQSVTRPGKAFLLKRGATIKCFMIGATQTHHHVEIHSIENGLGKRDWQKGDEIFIPIDNVVPALQNAA